MTIADQGTIYSRFVPNAALAMLGKDSHADVVAGDSVETVATVMFIDLRGFSALAEELELEGIVGVLNSWYGSFEPVITRHGGFVDKYIGDAIMAVFPGGPDEAIRCASEFSSAMAELNRARMSASLPALRAGVGINTGIAAIAAIGSPGRIDITIVGDTVNIASRMEAVTKTYGVDVLVSEHSYMRLSRPEEFKLRFLDRILVRGKRIPLSVYELYDGDPEPMRSQKEAAKPDFDRAVANFHYGRVAEAKSIFSSCSATCPGDAVTGEYLRRCDLYERTGVLERAFEMDTYPRWSPEFSVGHETIDTHHGKLFESVALLMRMIDADDYSKLGAIIQFLSKYVDIHFKTEEDLMRSCGYPLFADHKAQHERFVAVFSRLVQELAPTGQHGVYIAFRVRILVIDWLLNHTTKSDPHLGRYLARNAPPRR